MPDQRPESKRNYTKKNRGIHVGHRVTDTEIIVSVSKNGRPVSPGVALKKAKKLFPHVSSWDIATTISGQHRTIVISKIPVSKNNQLK